MREERTKIESAPNDYEPNTLADVAVILAEAEKFAEDTNKEIKAFRKTMERLTVMKYLQDATLVMQGEPIRTEYVTATPEMKTCAKIPEADKQPEEYAALMTYLGIDPVLWDKGKVLTELGEEETEVTKINWPGFQSLVTRLQAAGLPLPDGIDPAKTYQLFSLRMRKRKGLPIEGIQVNTSASILNEENPF